jgi:uncharacterized SAM-binding protein YcdF (DUF218 family)
MSEAEAMRAVLLADGVADDRILVEGRSRNTVENALFAQKLAQPKPGETWILVTSATHMPRAVGCFRHIGWSVVPYPVDFRSDAPWSLEAVVLSRNLALFELAFHEWVGLVTYRLLGWTDTLFPSP